MLYTDNSRNKKIIKRILARANFRSELEKNKFSKINIEQNKIWHLFFLLQTTERTIKCIYLNQTFEGRVVETSKDSIILYIDNFQYLNSYSIEIQFINSGNIFKTEVIIVEIFNYFVCVKIPENIQSQQQRKNPRIITDDLFINFTFCSPENNLSFIPNIINEKKHLTSEFRNTKKLIEGDEPNIELLYHEIKNKLEKYNLENEIIIFNENEIGKENKDNLIIEFLLKTNKTLFIQDTNNLESYLDKFIDEDENSNFTLEKKLKYKNFISNFSSLIEETDTTNYTILEQIKFLQLNDKKENLRSYAYSPLILFEKVIGYISLKSKIENIQIITPEQIEKLIIFSKYLSFAFLKLKISKKYFRNEYLQVINLSVNGMKLLIPNDKLFYAMLTHPYLKIKTNIKNYNINLNAKIVYNLKNEIKSYNKFQNVIGIAFTKKDPYCDTLLEQFIYEGKIEEYKKGVFNF